MATTIIILAALLINVIVFTDAQVGVCNGRVGNNLPSEQQVVNLYKRYHITQMRIYDPNPDTLRALRGTNIELILDVPNIDLGSLTDQKQATNWVRNNILNYPDVRFRYIAVGNEVDPNKESGRFADFVLPAMKNVQKAIADAGLAKQIKVSTATYTGLLNISYPPSDGVFKDNVQGFIQPIIRFLVENDSPMLANIYPYFAYIGTPGLKLSYALFTANDVAFYDQGRPYNNLFDAMYDAHYVAQSRLGGSGVRIVVSESGWPSARGVGATLENARTYYRNLIAHVKPTTGTPLRPGSSIETYLFAMFNENLKDEAESEQHFGVFYLNQTSKYQLSF